MALLQSHLFHSLSVRMKWPPLQYQDAITLFAKIVYTTHIWCDVPYKAIYFVGMTCRFYLTFFFFFYNIKHLSQVLGFSCLCFSSHRVHHPNYSIYKSVYILVF
jgi:hypothetical protein